MKELCIYCRNVISFREGDVAAYCPACGHFFRTALFDTELRDRKALENELSEKQASLDALNEEKQAFESEPGN